MASRGEKFQPSARQWNDMTAAAEAYKRSGGNSTPNMPPQRQGMIVRVMNDSDDQMLRWDAVRVVEPVVDPSVGNNENEFLSRIVLKVDTPTAESVGHWVCLLEDIAKDKVGDAMCVGMVQCWINLLDVGHTHV